MEDDQLLFENVEADLPLDQIVDDENAYVPQWQIQQPQPQMMPMDLSNMPMNHHLQYQQYQPLQQQFVAPVPQQQPMYQMPDDLSAYFIPNPPGNVAGTSSSAPREAKSKSSKRSRKPQVARTGVTCSHCATGTTTLWRKNDDGQLECNACNLYHQRNNVKRPLSLCKDSIMTRQRKKTVKREEDE